MTHISIALDTGAFVGLLNLQKHIHNNHEVDVTLEELANQLLNSNINKFRISEICVRCNELRK